MTHNPIRPWRNIERRKSRQIRVGRVLVGGDAPISVQTMTNTITSDVAATLEQIRRCAAAGADIVRVSTPDEASTRALKEIVAESPVPIVADIRSRRPRRVRPVCASIPATSAMPAAWPRWCGPRRTTAVRSGSA
jgi:(E)-4-hydroxy-3-methylbut-2-enyl-diphosphate synthase